MANKTFLQLCKDVCREASLAQAEDAMTTVTSQRGQIGRIVANVRQAWIEIQNQHQHSGQHWRWMKVGFTLNTVAGTAAYAYGSATDSVTASAITRFRNWLIKDFEEPPKCYLVSGGVGTEGYLIYLDWLEFKAIYRIGTQNDGYPAHVTIDPQNNLVLGPTPNDIYKITGEYMRSAQTLTVDADTPDLPEAFQDAIVFKALSRHGLQKNAAELVAIGEDASATYIGGLEMDQLSEIPIGYPMA